MATIQVSTPSVVISGSNTWVLGDGFHGNGSKIVLQFIDTGSFSGSLVIYGKTSSAPDTAYVKIPYKRRCLGSTASDDTTVSAALTAAFLIEVDSTGLDVAVTNTASSGSGTLYIMKVIS